MKHRRSIISIAMATLVLLAGFAVCATTSVSAAGGESSSASVQAAPSIVGSPIATGTGPAMCRFATTSPWFIFVQGHDHALWYRLWSSSTDSWLGPWHSLGGVLTSSPAAVSRQDGFLEVFVRGSNGAVYERPYYSGAWHSYVKVGGVVYAGTGPTATGWPSRNDIFVEGMDRALYQKTFTTTTGFSSKWVKLTGNGVMTSSPAAVGGFNVYYRGANGALIWASTRNAGAAKPTWTFSNINGPVKAGTGPGVNSYDSVFFVGTNGLIYWFNAGYGVGSSGAFNVGTPPYNNWWSIGAPPTGVTSSPAAVVTGIWSMQVWVRVGNGALWYDDAYQVAFSGWAGNYNGP